MVYTIVNIIKHYAHTTYATLLTPGYFLYVPSLSLVISLSLSASVRSPFICCFFLCLGERLSLPPTHTTTHSYTEWVYIYRIVINNYTTLFLFLTFSWVLCRGRACGYLGPGSYRSASEPSGRCGPALWRPPGCPWDRPWRGSHSGPSS